MKVRPEMVVGLLLAGALGAGGYFGVLAPQATGTQNLRDQVEAAHATNLQLQGQLPQLKSQLTSISGQVAALRSLSAKVPAQLDLPGLYAELDAAASASGVVGGAQNLTVTAPTLVDGANGGQPAAPAEDGGVEGEEAAPAAPSTPVASGGTIASFDVTMTVKGTLGQTIAFLSALKEAPRLSVVSTSSVSVTDGEATMNITAKYFLQKVDVDGMAAQIEQLAKTVKDATGYQAQGEPGAPTDSPESTDPFGDRQDPAVQLPGMGDEQGVIPSP